MARTFLLFKKVHEFYKDVAIMGKTWYNNLKINLSEKNKSLSEGVPYENHHRRMR